MILSSFVSSISLLFFRDFNKRRRYRKIIVSKISHYWIVKQIAQRRREGKNRWIERDIFEDPEPMDHRVATNRDSFWGYNVTTVLRKKKKRSKTSTSFVCPSSGFRWKGWKNSCSVFSRKRKMKKTMTLVVTFR